MPERNRQVLPKRRPAGLPVTEDFAAAEMAIHERAALLPGAVVAGPTIIVEEEASTDRQPPFRRPNSALGSTSVPLWMEKRL